MLLAKFKGPQRVADAERCRRIVSDIWGYPRDATARDGSPLAEPFVVTEYCDVVRNEEEDGGVPTILGVLIPVDELGDIVHGDGIEGSDFGFMVAAAAQAEEWDPYETV